MLCLAQPRSVWLYMGPTGEAGLSQSPSEVTLEPTPWEGRMLAFVKRLFEAFLHPLPAPCVSV